MTRVAGEAVVFPGPCANRSGLGTGQHIGFLALVLQSRWEGPLPGSCREGMLEKGTDLFSCEFPWFD